jgi:ribonuclease BN (tRNA processing enzyme)
MASVPAPHLTVLGSGTLLPDAQRSSASHLVQAPGVRLLLDCGTGTLHGLARHGVPWRTLTHVAISHFHNDHVGDLSALLFALKHGVEPPRTDPLMLMGPPGFRDFLGGLAAVLGEHVTDPGFPLDVREVVPGEALEHDGPFRLAAHGTPHTDESVAYRWEGEGGVVGYTGDTGPSEELAGFLAGADVLVCECALTDPPKMDGHLSPTGVAELARIARPRTLVLTHVFPPLTPAGAVEQVRAAGYPGEVVAAHDGLRLPIRA